MRIKIYLSISFRIENGLKQGNVLSPLLFNCVVEYTITKVEETNLGLDMKGIHQILDYEDVSIIGDDIREIERNADMLLNGCNNIDLAGATKNMEVGCYPCMVAKELTKLSSNF